ncbi:hypothetical protein J2Z76_000433 [Sedimentibacter acidaminivorans]|uniref:Uncharacterized protein n=1 Tax=Sedimentibacter acidaminivorans TaxID=913099 RepID=A0ABS4GA68_9FIRM|nr:hypothetical protein [Sedimentibacter acidaminivorans]MBP1924580.1 hypothetical protein [Sedimentibacter acidaminivorans]
MTSIQKRIILAGIRIKLNRGENLEEILAMYINLSEEEKSEIRNKLA